MTVKKYREPSLLDIMTNLAMVEFISDLKFMSREQAQLLSLKIRDIPAEDFPLRNWNAAINYLSQGPPAEDVETAKARLIAALKDPANRETNFENIGGSL